MSPDDAIVETLFEGQLGRFLCLSPIRGLISDAQYYETVRPYVDTPDLLGNEPRLVDEWRIQRTEFHHLAEAHARRTLSGFDFSGGGCIEDIDRLLLRMAAARRLDAWLAAGNDRTITRPTSFAGDLYWPLAIPGHSRMMKIGLNISPEYRANPRLDSDMRNLLQDEECLQEVEFALFPLAGRAGLSEPAHWRKVRAAWREVGALREHEATSPVPVLPSGYVFPDPPAGMVCRVPEEFLRVDPLLYLEVGLCPWYPEVTVTFLTAHAAQYPTAADDTRVRDWIRLAYLKGQRDSLPQTPQGRCSTPSSAGTTS